MPIFELNEEIIFPHASQAEEDGLLAIGGDLSSIRILTAYVNGIFPWFSEEDPILWWSPDPRCVIFPEKFKPSKSLRSIVQKNIFEVRVNTCFREVMMQCGSVERADGPGTWITQDMLEAYCLLHEQGWAHSVETFSEGQLVGGLYGLAIGKVFFGESMFFKKSNASKVAFYHLIEILKRHQFNILDNQSTTNHLLSLGAEEISRNEFLAAIAKAVQGFEKLKIDS